MQKFPLMRSLADERSSGQARIGGDVGWTKRDSLPPTLCCTPAGGGVSQQGCS